MASIETSWYALFRSIPLKAASGMALKWPAQREMALAGEAGEEGDIEGRGTDPLTMRLLA